MTAISWPGELFWKQWQKVLFRFFFCYFILYIEPWTWIEFIPGAEILTSWYHSLVDWAVNAVNKNIFKTYTSLVYPNGSGDTSYNWTQVWLLLWLAFIICLIWTLIDRKRANYNFLAYWARIFVRYFVIINCFGYGIIKIFALQMYFPSLSQLATPLGDYLPMRLSWMFMGYSTTYQQFSGVMEDVAGILMLFRRTSTLGTMMAAGIFFNVMMNLSYDIPVKLFSLHLFLMCLFLLAFEYKRISEFFLRNVPARAAGIYQIKFPKKWMRISRVVLKLLFVVAVVILPFKSSYDRYVQASKPADAKPFKTGVYNVSRFVKNGDTLAENNMDSLRWKDVIFDGNGTASINTTDTAFRQRYHRGYFNYRLDSTGKTISLAKSDWDGSRAQLGTFYFDFPDSNTVILRGRLRSDSIFAILTRMPRHFQLAERQFHWLSEYNR